MEAFRGIVEFILGVILLYKTWRYLDETDRDVRSVLIPVSLFLSMAMFALAINRFIN